ncbi:MAG TPA: carboxypeptidase regulatory-like domain-containing protein [Bacteroidales bacterium]|nr:carboxypeptidase regulatory-like domain-containing protein [Bacteroidales bacterium]HPL05389.1 carboxypeptidase regulatory-like domain-containing protein [Bacteroidales bacterium]
MLTLSIFSSCNKTEYDLYGDVYGIVSDSETGELISNASIIISPGGNSQTTGTDGRFEFKDLEAKQYTITVQKSGYQTNRKIVYAVSGESTEANILLTKNQ